MNIKSLAIGYEIHEFAKELWPINRSITGKGVRETLKLIKGHLPQLKINSVPSGTNVFDWTVPKEWSVKEAYIITPSGEKICNFSKNNLHLVGYSIPFEGEISFDELKKHLYTLPDQPKAIPYITSYYKERWGFCLSQEQFDTLENGSYKIVIKSTLFDGELNYGELLIKGKSDKEIFLSTYICHPSMANNELSGPTVVTFLAKWLQEINETDFSYRIIFIPETIGSITYLSKNYKDMKNKIFAGFNVSCVGDDRAFSYLPSRNGKTISDMIAKHVLKWIDPNFIKYSWLDRGSDERQYCAPGIDLPIASILRTKYGRYPEYHTSLDNLENVVTPKGLDGGYWAIRKAIEAIEKNKKYKITVLCEPQMGKRGLYPTLSTKGTNKEVLLMMNFISFCDGQTSLLEIAESLNLPIWELYELVDKLESHSLIGVNE
jgi:aminopeptidase-like protein